MVENRMSISVAGTFVLSAIYCLVLIDWPPFVWYDMLITWLYGWALLWYEIAPRTAFWDGLTLAVELIFFYFKYFFFGNILAVFSAQSEFSQ